MRVSSPVTLPPVRLWRDEGAYKDTPLSRCRRTSAWSGKSSLASRAASAERDWPERLRTPQRQAAARSKLTVTCPLTRCRYRVASSGAAKDFKIAAAMLKDKAYNADKARSNISAYLTGIGDGNAPTLGPLSADPDCLQRNAGPGPQIRPRWLPRTKR